MPSPAPDSSMSPAPMSPDKVLAWNRRAWDSAVENGSIWTIPVPPDVVAQARTGHWSIVLTPTRAVPRDWFPNLAGCNVLCLAGAGGQQAPLLAAAGANATVFDNSPAQLATDAAVAQREGLTIRCEQGDMADLSRFADGAFDLIVNPCSTMFVPAVRPIWREAFRVLRPGGALMAGFNNPATYIFDSFRADEGELIVRHALPYSDIADLTEAERARLIEDEQPFEWSHTLEDLIAGQIDAGFVITGFYEDRWAGNPLDALMNTFFATLAAKPAAAS